MKKLIILFVGVLILISVANFATANPLDPSNDSKQVTTKNIGFDGRWFIGYGEGYHTYESKQLIPKVLELADVFPSITTSATYDLDLFNSQFVAGYQFSNAIRVQVRHTRGIELFLGNDIFSSRELDVTKSYTELSISYPFIQLSDKVNLALYAGMTNHHVDINATDYDRQGNNPNTLIDSDYSETKPVVGLEGEISFSEQFGLVVGYYHYGFMDMEVVNASLRVFF